MYGQKANRPIEMRGVDGNNLIYHNNTKVKGIRARDFTGSFR